MPGASSLRAASAAACRFGGDFLVCVMPATRTANAVVPRGGRCVTRLKLRRCTQGGVEVRRTALPPPTGASCGAVVWRGPPRPGPVAAEAARAVALRAAPGRADPTRTRRTRPARPSRAGGRGRRRHDRGPRRRHCDPRRPHRPTHRRARRHRHGHRGRSPRLERLDRWRRGRRACCRAGGTGGRARHRGSADRAVQNRAATRRPGAVGGVRRLRPRRPHPHRGPAPAVARDRRAAAHRGVAADRAAVAEPPPIPRQQWRR
jgi:hypothetical protein